ncbi:copper transporter 2-like [Argentina anserina]|uniref:copper transporter 2-like n=1 Tax=Argentina anserina TaxID=57926 RepID=UPI0021768D6D|nr:copper transporter 2-like [Potentilla anserina]
MDMNMTMNNVTMDMTMQMSFYWGRDVTVLFPKWPGNSQHNSGMYILIWSAALSVWPIIKQLSRSPVAAGLTQASLHALRVSLGYFVMLAVMSYNIGVFIAAVTGHTVGFFVSKTSALAKSSELEPSTSI